MYGIFNMKLEKWIVEWCVFLMWEVGIEFFIKIEIGVDILVG